MTATEAAHLRAKVGVMISGTGSNMAALLYASRSPACPYEIVLVASNAPAAPGLVLAAAEGIATFALPHAGMARADHDAAIDAALRGAGVEVVALAGYMRVLTEGFVARWQGRMLNIHPSLLPLYKGLHTHERALANGDAHAGCSVHIVTPTLDDGPVLGQTRVAVIAGDTPASLAARVLIAEHQLYAPCLAAFVSRTVDPQYLTGQVRALALAQPQAEETLSHGMACFGIGAGTGKTKGKKFAWVSNDHHGDGRVALLAKISGMDERAMLIERDPERYYRPAYFSDGWIAMRLDLGDNDWDEIGAWIARSWRMVAPAKLTRLLDAANEF